MGLVKIDAAYAAKAKQDPMYSACVDAMTRLSPPVTADLIGGERVTIIGALNNGIGWTIMVQPPALIGKDPLPVARTQLANPAVWENIVKRLTKP